MTGSRSPRLANLLAGAALALVALGLLMLALQAQAGNVRLDSNTIGGYVLGATFPIVGWLIATRRPDNAMGWIFIAIGLSQALDAFAGQYAFIGLVIAPGTLPAADLMAWLAVWAWAPGFVLILTAAVLLFPDGRLPSPRWRAVGWLAGVALALLIVPIAIVAWSNRGPDLVAEGPITGQNGPAAFLLGLQFVGLVVLAVAAAASIVGLFVRFRRSVGVERAQLKWFVAAGIVEVTALVVSGFITLPNDLLGLAVTVVVSMLLPIAAAIAILRYRLYDIDRIVSRTIGWAIVTGALIAIFAAAVVALEAALSGITQDQTIAVAASTLLVFALFQPLRRRVQRTVDRRFDRSRYDGQLTADAFAERLRGEVAIDALAADLATTIDGAVRPATQGLWLRKSAS